MSLLQDIMVCPLLLSYTVYLILSYSEQETENEFPFLEEVYTPASQSKIEYESPSPYAREEADTP